jgi:uncharacterized membrane protein
MANLIIASFKQEVTAIEGLKKLNELESIGDITIYEMVLLKKNADGETVVLQSDTTEGANTLAGMTIGAVIGSLAGPVGTVMGLLAGTLTGSAVEIDHYGFADDFVAKAGEHLPPDSVALVAEIDEEAPIFVDSTLTPLGATLTRTDVDYEYDKYSDEEMDELDEEIAAKRAKLKAAAASDKAKFQEKIDALKEKRKEKIAEFREKVKEAATDVKAMGKERKISRIRNKIEKYQQKIVDLEKKLQGILEKEPLKAVES